MKLFWRIRAGRSLIFKDFLKTQSMAQAVFFSPHFQCSRRWVFAESHRIGTIIERKNMDPTLNCAIISTLLSTMKSARCRRLSFFGSANTYTSHFIISGRFQKSPTHASKIPSNRAPPRTRVIGIFTLPGNHFSQNTWHCSPWPLKSLHVSFISLSINLYVLIRQCWKKSE